MTFMRTIIFIFFVFTICSYSFGQNLNFRPNLSGKLRITYNDVDQEIIDALADTLYNIILTDTVEIQFDENQSTIVFRFCNAGFKYNDTLNLDFIQYHSVDTINFSASCIDGSHSENKESYVERNKGFIEVDELPESIDVLLNSGKIKLLRSVDSTLEVTSGNGKKLGKRWGFHKTTKSKHVIYSN